MPPAQIEVFEAGKAPGAYHQERYRHHERAPGDRRPPVVHGITVGKVHDGSKHRRSNPEGNNVGQGVKLTAKVAGRVGQARNAAIQTIQYHGYANGLGGIVEVPKIFTRSLQCLQNGVVAGGDVAHGKQRGQQVHAFPEPAALPGGIFLPPQLKIHRQVPFRAAAGLFAKRAITLEPPFTRSPTFTTTCASGENITSVREPNLIRPTRSPRPTFSPTFFVNTILRAINPAICLKMTFCPSPSTVTTFCSFSSAQAGPMALRNLPLRYSALRTTPLIGERFT